MKPYFKTLVLMAGVAVAYFYSGKLGLSLAFVNVDASAVWPPTGIALATLLIGGYRLWPAIFIGSFLVDFTTQGLWATSLGIATGDTLEALVATELVRRFADGLNSFERSRTTFRFILLAAIFSTMISATFGVVSLGLVTYAERQPCWAVWSTWWIGNMTSNLLIAPLLLIWITKRLPKLSAKRLLEGVALLLTLVWVSQLVFWRGSSFAGKASLDYLIIPPLLWATFRFGLHGAITSAFVVSGFALWGTLHQQGPFLTADPNETLLLLQTFTGIITMTMIVLAAIVSERERFRWRLEVKDAISRILVESTSLSETTLKILQALCERAGWDVGAIWLVDRTANKLFCSGLWQSTSLKKSKFDTATRQIQFAPGEGLPGRVWLSGKPAWIPDVTRDDNFQRAQVALEAGLHSAFCFPILLSGEIIGVMECFRRDIREPDIDFINMLIPLGHQLGLFIERKAAEEALVASEERYRLVVEDQTETICRFTSDGTFTYVNEAYCRLFGKTKTELLGNKWQPRAAKEDLPEIEDRLRMLSPSHRVVVVENRVFDSAGALRWFQFVNRAYFDAEGVLVETQSIGRDITERKQAEASLRDSQLRFKQVTESIREVFWMINVANTEMVYISPAYENIWGRTCASLYASPQDWLDAVHPEDFERIREAASSKLVSGDYDEEYRIVRPDGAIRWIRARGFPVNDESNKIYRVAGICEDITLRKQAEFDLALLAHGMESTSELICITDLQNRFVFTNQAFREAFGYTTEEIIGATPGMLYSPNNSPLLLNQILEQSHAGGWSGEVLERRNNGTEFPVFLRTSQIKDHSGKVIALMAVADDITEAKKAEWKLKELADIVQGSRDAIIRLTTERIIVIWNKGAEELLGYQAAEAVGRNISIVLPPDRAEEATAIRAKINRGELVEIPETVRRCKDGTLRNVSLKISPMFNPDGKLIGSAAIIRDITEKKRLEKMLLEISANERRRIGHDLHDGLGQHLAGTAFRAKALEEALAGEVSAHAEEAGRIVNLINEGISQTRTLAQGLDPVDLEIAGLPAALQKLAGQTAAQFKLTCEFRCNQERLNLESLVGLALFRIAQESIHNAIGHGKAKQIVIDLEASNDRLCLTIRDNGTGFMVQENLKSGMGLRIMRYRANSIGGNLAIHSQMNVGTEVVCIAPQQTCLI